MTLNSTLRPDIGRAKFEALKLARSLHITKPAQYELEDVAMLLGIYVREEPLLGAEARLIRNGSRGLIRLSSSIINRGRKRFTIAHELGHWLLHDTNIQIDTPKDILESSPQKVEIEANTFAGVFLMPSYLFSPLCSNETPTLELISSLAEKFATTLTATAFRFVEEAVFPCAIVFSEGGIISWWVASKSSRIWLECGQEIDSESTAFSLKDGERSPRQRIPFHRWFESSNQFGGLVLFEQSTLLGRYGLTVTLLSLEEKLGH
jgi:Zn-dependent peptidase ImmA (M78 family)